MIGMRTALALALTAVALPAAAQNAQRGGQLAERWCMGCHVVERVPPPATTDGPPSFVTIAARPTTTAASLNLFLSKPHAKMGDFALSPDEREALVDYILSLR